MDRINHQGWIGREEVRIAALTPEAVQAWMLTVSDESTPDCQIGAALPQLAHWIAFNPQTPMADLGQDGHPKLGGFLPPLDLPRRMWAGGSLQFHLPLHVGERLTKRSVLKQITEKVGATGPMVFVTVDHEISGEDGLAISERQDIVYLPMPERYTPPKPVPAPDAVEIAEDFEISTARLFRYSAVTFNAHRIHYDQAYAREVEKLPGLVVHGPMQATALIHMGRRAMGTEPDAFRFRSIHPMFHTENLRLLGLYETDRTMHLCTAAAQGGHVGMQASASWGVDT